MTALSQTPVIRIRVDSSAATPGINSINRQLGTLGTTGGTANQQLSRLVTNFGSAGAAAGNTSRQLSAANSNAQALHSMFGSLGQSAGAAASRMAGLGGSITGVAMAGSTLVAGALVGGLVALGSAAVNASAKMESYRASLTTILGDSDKAATAMARLSEFAAKTPFSLDQSVQGFIKLKALGLQPTEAAMMSYGNTASAMGKDMMQLVEAVADASTGEFERLKEFGIKASKEGDKVSFVFQGVKTTVKNNSQEIQKYLQDIGNNQFGGAMQKQMATFAGAMSNLEDTIDQTMARVGDAGLNKAVASVITMISDGITSVAPLLTGLGNMMAGAVSGVVALVSGVGDIFGSINTAGPGGITIMEKLSFVLSALGYSFNLIGTIAGAAFSAVGAVVQNVSQMMTGAMGGALSWLGVSFQSSGRSWGNSIMGVMRAVQTVATLMPQIFSIAVNDVMRMFRDLGGAISALLSGNWEQAKALATKVQFTNTNQAVAAAWKMGSVTYRDEKGADAELQRFLGRAPKVGTESLGDLAGAAPKAAADAAKKEADDAAKKAAERLKRENEFWTALKDQTTAAGMLRKEAENYNKQVELRKILERDLLPAEQARLTTALKELDTAKILGSMRQRALDLSNEYTAEQGRQLGLTESQKAVEDEVIKARLAALNEGVDISSTAYKIAEADLMKQAEKVQALKEQRDLIKQANDFAGKFSTGADRMSRLFDLDKQMENFRKQFADGKLTFNGQPMSQAIFDAATNGWSLARQKIEQEPLEIAAKYDVKLDRQMRIGDVENERREMQSSTWFQGLDKKAQERILSGVDGAVAKIRGEATDDFIDMFDDLASQFGGKIGKAIKGVADMIDRIAQASRGEDGAGKLLTMISTGMGDGYKAAASSMLDIAGSAADMGKTTKSLLSNFGKGGSITKGIGQAVGGAMAGLEIGTQVGSAMKGLGIKGSDGGAKIGGTIGGITGNPIIAAGASVIGGLIGSMFYKAPAGAAYLKGQDPASVVGTNKGAKKAAGEAGEAVQAGLAAIADRLGGTLGAYDVIIGKYNDKWRVRDGTEDGWAGKSLDFKGMSANGLKDFGDDASAAISYAIQNAIKDGAIKGISDFASKALSKLDVDAAVSLVEAFNSITDELDAMVDPIGQAARAINKPIDQLIDQMKEVGAASADLAKMEEYRTKKLDEALKAQVSSIDDMLTKLRGEARGVTKLQQFDTAMKEFDAYRTRIDAGDKTVDQNAFLALVDKIAGLNTEIYGNATNEAQANFNALIMASEKLKTNVTDTFNTAAGRTTANVTVDNTSAAIAQQTSALASATKRVEDQIANDNAIMKEYLRQIASGISGMNDNSRGEGVLYRQNTLNGQYLSDRA